MLLRRADACGTSSEERLELELERREFRQNLAYPVQGRPDNPSEPGLDTSLIIAESVGSHWVQLRKSRFKK